MSQSHPHPGRPTTRSISDLDTYQRKFVSPIQLADYLGVTTRTIYHHIEKGALSARKIGGVLRIPLAVAREYAQGVPVAHTR